MLSSRTTTVALDASRTIESGETIIVNRIKVSNSSAGMVTVNINNSTDGTLKMPVTAVVGETVLDTPFIADKGIQIDSVGSSAVKVTLFHTAPGA